MNEQIRRPEQISPKSSPRGSISPAYQRPDSSGTLKTTISLGKVPSVLHSGPFYLMKDMPVSLSGVYLLDTLQVTNVIFLFVLITVSMSHSIWVIVSEQC